MWENELWVGRVRRASPCTRTLWHAALPLHVSHQPLSICASTTNSPNCNTPHLQSGWASRWSRNAYAIADTVRCNRNAQKLKFRFSGPRAVHLSARRGRTTRYTLKFPYSGAQFLLKASNCSFTHPQNRGVDRRAAPHLTGVA